MEQTMTKQRKVFATLLALGLVGTYIALVLEIPS